MTSRLNVKKIEDFDFVVLDKVAYKVKSLYKYTWCRTPMTMWYNIKLIDIRDDKCLQLDKIDSLGCITKIQVEKNSTSLMIVEKIENESYENSQELSVAIKKDSGFYKIFDNYHLALNYDESFEKKYLFNFNYFEIESPTEVKYDFYINDKPVIMSITLFCGDR